MKKKVNLLENNFKLSLARSYLWFLLREPGTVLHGPFRKIKMLLLLQHHYSLISLRDFTISLQFPQNLDITPVSVTGTCQNPFTQLRTVKLICKLNESPETCQEYLPQARLLVMLSTGASSVPVSHSAHFVSSSALCADGDIS